jgi:hypothetical protein
VNNKRDNIVLSLSLILAILVIIISLTGIFSANFYQNETPNWQAQSLGQDIVDLFLIAPLLIVTSFLSWRKNKIAAMLWGGVLLYLIYTFTIYCFDVHFNNLFVVYCIILGLSFYLFVYFLISQSGLNTIYKFENNRLIKITGFYFLVVSIMFYLLWLSEILPAVISGTVPKGNLEAGLVTNPVHVLDLSVILPGIFITGVLLLKNKPFGFIMAPVLLMFFILMNITIGTLIVFMSSKGIASDLSLTAIFGVLTVFSLLLLIGILRKYQFDHAH